MQKERSMIDLYEKNHELINTLRIDPEIKEQVLKVNKGLYNLATTTMSLQDEISIFIENIEQRVINILIDNLMRILNDYEIYTKKPNIIEDKYFHIRKDELVIVDNYSIIENNIKDLKREVNNNKCLLIIGKESPYPKDFFNEQYLNSRIVFHITKKDYTEAEILANLKNRFNENNIKYNIKDSEWQNIITKSLKNNECYYSNCAEYLFKIATHNQIIDNIDIITRSCYEKIEQKSHEQSKISNLSDLIGLDNVKKEITSLKNYLAMQKRIGNTFKTNYLNMLFLGNPGTGKTTVGKIYANILYELGYIKENKLIEIIPTDLMANYVGQTKDQTRKILNKARGGVLFIDEAYLMANITYSDGFASYMGEAIVELMKYMENPENVIIFAGYPLETRKIYDSNPGMKSRICKEIIFEDYNEEELLQILKNNFAKINFKIDKKATNSLKKIIKAEKAKKNFGNARFCNVLMQQLLMNYANRITDKDTYEIIEEDTKLENNQTFQIGFIEE